MPTYEYACTECDHSFEQVQSFSDDALTVCPQCQGRLRKVFNAVGVVFKGSGFYRTDSRSADASAQSEGKQSEGKQNGKQNGKQSDGKPAKTGESGGDSGGGSGGDSGGDKTSSTEKPAAKTGSGEKASSPKDSSSAA